ncbi:hypothetical protein KKE45_01965 [Patescibacteria group bacterium]|nr:hypothetical protein [Patescibacteria group bacterium]
MSIKTNESKLRGGSCHPWKRISIVSGRKKRVVAVRDDSVSENIVMERERLRSCKRWRESAIEEDGVCGSGGPVCIPLLERG